MSAVLTLVSSKPDYPVTDEIIVHVRQIIHKYDVMPTCEAIWLKKNVAADIGITERGNRAMIDHLHDYLLKYYIDVFITDIEHRRKKLLIADMDSTIIKGETLDDLAEHAGLKDKIAEITMRAMNGDLDFHQAIHERVKLLQGLDVQALTETLAKMETNRGARTFIKTMRENGAICVLVSGGFTVFTTPVAQSLLFNNDHGNVLGIENDKLTGKVTPPILDKNSKVQFLKDYMSQHKLKPHHCMTIGDGANDLPMLQEVSLGIGYHPKETVRKGVTNSILHGDLTAALYAQGYLGADFFHINETKL